MHNLILQRKWILKGSLDRFMASFDYLLAYSYVPRGLGE